MGFSGGSNGGGLRCWILRSMHFFVLCNFVLRDHNLWGQVYGKF
jgi:hypothetical protein